MKYSSTALLEDLFLQSEQYINQAITEWQQLPSDFLTAQPGVDQWSAVQCLEHLNSYGRYYLPAMQKAITAAPSIKNASSFSSGWLGNYFYKLMLPGSNGIAKKKLKAPKDHRPPVQLNQARVLEEFISQLENLQQLLTLSHQVDLNKATVPISIFPFIKLKLGDTFLFYVAHVHRHMLQAGRALYAAGYQPSKLTSNL